MSNFVLPAYFNPAAAGPYDYLVCSRNRSRSRKRYAVWDRATADHDAYGRHVVTEFSPETPRGVEAETHGLRPNVVAADVGGSDPKTD